MKPIRMEFNDADHQAIRLAAAKAGLPMKHFAVAAVLEAARHGLRKSTPSTRTPSPARKPTKGR